jgi:hypothetical protein
MREFMWCGVLMMMDFVEDLKSSLQMLVGGKLWI